MRFFFYGTLLDPEVLRIVLGDASAARRLEPATVEGFRRVYVAGKTYPILVRKASSTVAGATFDRATPQERDALVRYEGDGYVVEEHRATLAGGGSVPVSVFVPRPGGTLNASDVDWDFETWAAKHRAAFLSAIEAHR